MQVDRRGRLEEIQNPKQPPIDSIQHCTVGSHRAQGSKSAQQTTQRTKRKSPDGELQYIARSR